LLLIYSLYYSTSLGIIDLLGWEVDAPEEYLEGLEPILPE